MSNALNNAMRSAWPSASSPSSSTPAASSGKSSMKPKRSSKLNLNSIVPPGSFDDTPEASTSSTNTQTSSVKRNRTRPSDIAAPSSSSTRERESKRQKTATLSSVPNSRLPPTTRLSSMGGLDTTIVKLLEQVALPLQHPELFLSTGIRPPRGVLLHGPPGCGKTMMANALAGELGLPFIAVSAPSIISGMSGESEKTLRETFEEAQKLAPCLLFIDEIDAITPKRETAQREMERRIVAQLLTCMDDLSWEKNEGKPVIVIGATNRPDSLDPALRRAGRFDHEIAMGVPDEAGREQILKVLCSNLNVSGDFDIKALAKATPGYVGADLSSLAAAAGVIAVKRMFKSIGEGTLVLPELPAVEDVEDIAVVENQVQTVSEAQEHTGEVAASESMEIDAEPAACNGVATSEPAPAITTPTTTPAPLLEATSVIEPDSDALLQDEVTLPVSHLFQGLPVAVLATPIARFLLAYPSPLKSSQLSPLSIIPSDFFDALQTLQPSSKREGFATVPDVTWSDIGALHSTRDELHMAIVQPIRRPELFKRVGIEAPSGVLLWGPPGCGKTLLAKAVANESRANFISVKGPELLNKYVGESERAVRQVFSRARASAPCVIFFDELDALVPRRDDGMSESSARVVNTLLTELDGLESRKGIYVIGATNRPDMIDPAMVRPGRLDKLLYVDLPTPDERVEILKTMTKKTPLAPETQLALENLGRSKKCDGLSGADLAALVREAATLALRSALERVGAFEDDDGDQQAAKFERLDTAMEEDPANEEDIRVTQRHFEQAVDKIQPSVSSAQYKRYIMLKNKFAGLPTRGKRDVELDGPAQTLGDSTQEGAAPATVKEEI